MWQSYMLRRMACGCLLPMSLIWAFLDRSNCQKITDIYAEFSCDYSPEAKETKAFYLAVRNMMQYDNELNAITTALLDIAEDRARRHIITTMAEWKKVFSHLHKHGFHEQE